MTKQERLKDIQTTLKAKQGIIIDRMMYEEIKKSWNEAEKGIYRPIILVKN
jgi:hypothetical protein